jgi:hypothetical protein
MTFHYQYQNQSSNSCLNICFYLLTLVTPFFFKKMSKRWVRIQGKYAVKVSTEGCQDIDDFIKAIKKEFPTHFTSVETDQISLSTADGTLLERDNPIPAENTAKKALLVSIDTPEIPTGSSRKQLTYKGLSTEASCRKYMDALAYRLAGLYQFKWGRDGNNNYPSIGDVLYARRTNAWDFQYRFEESSEENGFTAVSPKSIPVYDTPLPEIFTADEWTELRIWNDKTNKRIHSANLPETSAGKYFVILPHDDYNQKSISFFKRIGVKGQLFADERKLEVKDDQHLSSASSSSSSESCSPDKAK